jgi:hypothetical protein
MTSAELFGNIEAEDMAGEPHVTDGMLEALEAELCEKPTIYAGFIEHSRRLLFPYEDHFPSTPQLRTLLPSGIIENSKRLEPKKGKAIICYAVPQSMSEKQARTVLVDDNGESPFVWQRSDGSFALVQSWSSDYNAKFQKEFEISETNPDEGKFSSQAAQEFRYTVEHLFGPDAAAQKPILYCHRSSRNEKKVYVGTSEVLFAFIRANPHVQKEMSILAIFKAGIVVGLVDGKGQVGLKDFGMAVDVSYALYTKLGWTTMACLTPLDQFMRERELLDLIA